MNLRRRRRQAGQTLVLFALLLGVLLVCVALVIDNGTMRRVRAESQAVADSASLAGIAEIASSRDPVAARALAIEYCRLNGYVVGQAGVTGIEAYSYDSSTMNVDTATSDRYHVKIHRELPQYIMSAFGLARTGTTVTSVSALLSAAPVDVNLELDINPTLGGQLGFPDQASLAQHGPESGYDRGDPFATEETHLSLPNGTWQPNGLRYDLVVPDDLLTSNGSGLVRLEIFDADCYNDPAKDPGGASHVVERSARPADTNGDPTEPETGGLDEILPPAPSMGNTTAAQFPSRSNQTSYILLDKNANVIAEATYGPSSNTPYYLQAEDPQTSSVRVASAGDPAMAQGSVDLKWITPQGFEFDTGLHAGPYRLMIQTTAGSSENGFSLRLSTHRAEGVTFDPMIHGVTATSALGIYAHGKAVINFMDVASAKFTVAAVPSETEYLRIQNFDTEVPAGTLWFSMTSFDTVFGDYPILFDADPSASGPSVVEDTDGNKHYVRLSGTKAPNAAWRAKRLDIPDPVPVPETDGSGNLLFDGDGRVRIVDTRTFEGGEVLVEFTGGAANHNDTSGWQFSYFKPDLVTGEQDIILIR